MHTPLVLIHGHQPLKMYAICVLRFFLVGHSIIWKKGGHLKFPLHVFILRALHFTCKPLLWLVGLVGWSVGWFVCWLVGWWVGGWVDSFIGWLLGWLLVGVFINYSNLRCRLCKQIHNTN